jgi:DNA polymerase-1
VGNGADEVRQQYVSDPNTDYHVFTQHLVKEKTGKLIERKPIKNINFGLLYGMGKAKLTAQLGISSAEADSIFDAYHGGAPYVKATMDKVAHEAEATGVVRTISGRCSYFEQYVPTAYDAAALPLPYAQAIARYGSKIKRAHTHKGINRKLQGSAADMMKAAMLVCYEQGIFDAVGVPRLTVHDELDFSVAELTPLIAEGLREMKHVMETAMPLHVPILVEGSRGSNWGNTVAVLPLL